MVLTNYGRLNEKGQFYKYMRKRGAIISLPVRNGCQLSMNIVWLNKIKYADLIYSSVLSFQFTKKLEIMSLQSTIVSVTVYSSNQQLQRHILYLFIKIYLLSYALRGSATFFLDKLHNRTGIICYCMVWPKAKPYICTVYCVSLVLREEWSERRYTVLRRKEEFGGCEAEQTDEACYHRSIYANRECQWECPA